MKTLFVAVSTIFMSSFGLSSVTKVVNSSIINISPSSIEKVVRLVDKNKNGSSHKKISIIVTDHGMSTDMSPRNTIYLGFAGLAEMGNITADFEINDQAFMFISAKRISAGIYQVKTQEYREEGLLEVTQTIDASKVFSDENKLRKNCGGSFCDETLKTSVTVTETIKKIE